MSMTARPARREPLTDWAHSTSNRIEADIEAIRFRSDKEIAMEEDGREGDSPHAFSPSSSGAEPGLVIAVSFFSALFTSSGVDVDSYGLRGLFPPVGADTRNMLTRERSQRLQQELVVAYSPVTAVQSCRNDHASEAVHWLKPQRDWCKLKMDGSVGRGSGLATCGGLLAMMTRFG
ncbi:hypothetical protein V6N11_058863 [Hibiscus sabdariffa]|uniref:Uncharacterized protein n=1 Tax=Hibiscus sabdariffa TaxID=183260 RepID=A0ABR2U5H3_9ROSI